MRRDLVCHSCERLRGSVLVLLWVNGLEPSLPSLLFHSSSMDGICHPLVVGTLYSIYRIKLYSYSN